MSRLIDADALLKKMSGHCDVCQYHCHRKHTSCGECDWHEAMSDVDDMDEIEIESIRHGYWIRMTGMMPPEYHGHYECSICKWHGNKYSIEKNWKFCPNCGAKMDEVRE